MHEALPQTMTPENLAAWLTENKIESQIYVKKTDLTPEAIIEYEHKSSVASRNMDTLDELKKQFMVSITEGTGDRPVDYQVPPTKGMKALKANRVFADACIKNGYEEQEIELYSIPWPEEEKIVWFDIEGNAFDGSTITKEGESDFETPDMTTEMTDEQRELYNKPLLKEVKEAGGKKKGGKGKRGNFMEDQTELSI